MPVISGGTTLINNGGLDSGVAVGKLTLISTQTASSSASISFTSNIDSTYDSYIFKIINVHPSADGADFTFNMSSDGGSNYNVTKTSTHFNARHALILIFWLRVVGDIRSWRCSISRRSRRCSSVPQNKIEDNHDRVKVSQVIDNSGHERNETLQISHCPVQA